MKTWLVKTMAPYYGTEAYYGVYSDEDPTQWIYDNWWDEEVQRLWDEWSFRLEDGWEYEWEEMSGEDREDCYDGDYDQFMGEKYLEFAEDCSLDIEECKEEDWDMYVPGGEGKLEVIYDRRSDS